MWYEHITLPRVLRCYKVQESVLESLLYAQLTYGFISVDLWILVKYICDQGYLSRPEYTDSDYSYYTLEKIKRYEFSHIGSLLIFNFYIVYNTSVCLQFPCTTYIMLCCTVIAYIMRSQQNYIIWRYYKKD